MARQHQYRIKTVWTGNLGSGTENYQAYSRDHLITAGSKLPIAGSSDPAFRGNNSRYNPEELLVSALSSCHMLWYLHLCASAGIVITEYTDHASGTMAENTDGSGQFTGVMLCPRVTITDRARAAEAQQLHAQAHQLCFIANSVNFPVQHSPEILIAE